MRILGLDYGTKTLGIAVSDLTETISSAVTTLRFDENNPLMIINDLKKIIDEYNVKLIVVGLPKNMNNSEGEAVLRTRKFIRLLKDNFNIDIVEQDERLSSVSANKLLLEADVSRKKRKSNVDTVAATIILQNYLDRRKDDKHE